MNENIDLTKILKDCPRGWKLYSSVSGEVVFIEVLDNAQDIQRLKFPIKLMDESGENYYVTLEGKHRWKLGECTLFPSKDQRDWSKFKAPWYKKDKLVEPKFKVGDWVISSVLGTARIMGVNDSNEYQLEYIDGEQKFSSIDYVNYAYDKWTIKDVKDGDVLANDHHILILKELVYDWSSNGTPYSVKAYCGIKPNGNFEIGKDNWSFCGTLHIHPATKEQRDTLMKAMNDAGYEWDAEKKELKKLVPNRFDPKTLKPFDKILVRRSNENHDVWFPDFVSDPPDDTSNKTLCMCIMDDILMVIPYNVDTKHLVGTSEEAPEFYRHWED